MRGLWLPRPWIYQFIPINFYKLIHIYLFIFINLCLLRKGLDTVESLSAGAARLKLKILALFPLLEICAEFYPKLFAQSNGSVVTSSKNLYIGPLVTLMRNKILLKYS